MNRSGTPATRKNLVRVGVLLLATASLFACSKSDGDKASTDGGTTPTEATTPATNPDSAVTTTAAPSGGKPSFTSFEVSKSAPCESGNATATMSFETENVDSIAISIDGGEFASTAGYGPNESAVVASIPCTGAATATIQLQGCSGTDQCVESDKATVDVTAA